MVSNPMMRHHIRARYLFKQAQNWRISLYFSLDQGNYVHTETAARERPAATEGDE
jgi:hypothetical protein